MPRIRRSRVMRYIGGISAIKYLLQDEFTTTRAAGAINGTAAEPGPGTRVSADTANKLTIASGKLTGDGGSGAWGDPGLYLDAVTRAAGRIVIAKMVYLTDTTIEFGFGPANSGRSWEATIGSNGVTGLRDVGSGTLLTAFVAGTTYYLAVVLRASGHFQFIKGGVYTYWTLLYISVLGNTTPVYPCVYADTASWTTDFIRVPFDLWTPPLITDAGTPHIHEGADMYAVGSEGQYSILDRYIA